MLENELREKQKIIDSLQGKLESDRNRSYVMQPHAGSVLGGSMSTTAQRNKERELERKIKDLEATIAKDKKQIMRLNEVNGQLLEKIKGHDAVMDQHKGFEEKLDEKIKELQQEIVDHEHENQAYHFF